MKTVFLDITELRGNPVRTGIQRMVRQLLKAWPTDVEAVPVVYDSVREALRIISQETVEFLIESGDTPSMPLRDAVDQVNFLDDPARSPTITLREGDKVHIPELFFDEKRTVFHRKAIASGVDLSVWIPDFIPWLRPECFPRIPSFHPYMHYLWLVFEARKRAFISAAVRDDFERRIYRRPSQGTIVTDLGADAINIGQQTFNAARKDLIFLGTLEPRKAQHVVYNAFIGRTRHPDLRLTFIGAIPEHGIPADFMPLVKSKRPDVRLLTDANDSDVAEIFKGARATVYTSQVEGYGLPPMESLYAGVPVIVRDNLPALVGKPDFGQLRLGRGDEEDIRSAIDIIGDDQRCAALWEDARRFSSRTWQAVARQIADWA
ncbi:glycosyltransferase [Azorhizobium caulinodans]|uniref:glycosyltransferase n=1 Tax=Azorhizobium caulinodans TaxID=7 RepID=UPI002FBE12F2